MSDYEVGQRVAVMPDYGDTPLRLTRIKSISGRKVTTESGEHFVASSGARWGRGSDKWGRCALRIADKHLVDAFNRALWAGRLKDAANDRSMPLDLLEQAARIVYAHRQQEAPDAR